MSVSNGDLTVKLKRAFLVFMRSPQGVNDILGVRYQTAIFALCSPLIPTPQNAVLAMSRSGRVAFIDDCHGATKLKAKRPLSTQKRPLG